MSFAQGRRFAACSDTAEDASAAAAQTAAARKLPVWSWTDAVVQADIQPLTKLVCLNIARYLSSAGKGWRISVKDMMRDTGLSNRSIATHLQLAADAKLIIIKRELGPHGQRGVTTYIPCFPDGVELAREAEMPPSEPGSRGPREAGSPGPDAAASLRPSEPGSRQRSSQEKTSHSPSTPKKQGRAAAAIGVGGFAELLKQLKGTGCAPHVVDALIAQVVDAGIIVPNNPAGLFRTVCKHLAQYPARVLSMAADELIAGTSRRIKVTAPQAFHRCCRSSDPQKRR